ncbi:flagellar basal body L-ring protein FlgH [Hahella aquimaris]|uniref:flagellar basal body L-ring protein FlgH n=1 Tax=Hahella sp. HNIBRBA332 TaxID=3015983 RepID=UPI00273B4232|nr:flagellar basal body L-ring protein FlgH [Hahella sp. HNIBRBA332]WLQ17304.1 flagellar basal body L-ring protein FlgH [Hahella sp. HNIBRBA332]
MKTLTLISLIMVTLLSGCSPISREQVRPGDPAFAPVPPQTLMQPAPVDGSIYSSAQNFSLFGDRTAHQVGDVLTVVLQESTQSSKSTGTNLKKDSENSFNEATVLGTAISAHNLSLLTDSNFERDFSGSADADQSNSLTGSISVTISDVLPNGVLRIRGEKWLTLTEGDEYIRLSGLVRPQDIGVDNTILSSKIADARFAYSGTGAFGDVNRAGWLQRFFNSEWFPL